MLEEKNANDVELNLRQLVSLVSHKIAIEIPDAQEVAYRLYGGWVLLDSQYSLRATWLLSKLSDTRGRAGGLRARLSMATCLIAEASMTLVGTYRDKGQKMVDTMISVDLVRLADDNTASLVLVSDDDDFVPGLLEGATRRAKSNPVYCFRRNKRVGQAPNDHFISRSNIKTASL